MIALEPEEMKIVTDIITELASDCNVYAYGSRAKGTNKKSSDLDLAFALPNGASLPLTRLGDLKEAFRDSDLGFRVDVTDYNGVERYFREIIGSQLQKISDAPLAKKAPKVVAPRSGCSLKSQC
jgi:predicted nucleotidyltransferase